SCSCLSSVSTRTLTSSTLFPYTTLFRSTFFDDVLGSDNFRIISHILFFRSRFRYDDFCSCKKIVVFEIIPLFDLSNDNIKLTCEDRKSTRLNSSHVKISYAVSCLKKKIH